MTAARLRQGVGVILHIENPTLDDAVQVAIAAEEAGADWIGLPDAFWWRDTWMLALEVARATRTIAVGPLVTNPFMRHRFHTIAALATLHDSSGGRAMLGLGAGGSEITDAANVSRAGAGHAIVQLVEGLRAVASGAPLHEPSGRRLSVPIESAPPVVVAGRGAGVLRAGGAVGDAVLLWALPARELPVAIDRVQVAARDRESAPAIIWAPLVDHTGDAHEQTAYAVINSSAESHRAWGLNERAIAELRRVAVADGNRVASRQVSGSIAAEFVQPGDDPHHSGTIAASHGVSAIAVRADSADSVSARVSWARRTLQLAAATGAQRSDRSGSRAQTR